MRSMVEGAACRSLNPLRQPLRGCHLPASGEDHGISNSSASWSTIAPASWSASMMVTARL